MKRRLFTAFVCTALLAGGAVAQQEVETQKPMKVEVKEKNGETTLIITTEENGMPIEQIYTGEEAKKKLAEIQGEGKEEGKQIEVELAEVEGEKKLTVITRENGTETTEIFTGEAAEEKLKELEGAEPKTEKKAEEFKMESEKPKVLEKSVD